MKTKLLILTLALPLLAETNSPTHSLTDAHYRLTPDPVVFRYDNRTYEAVFTVTNVFAQVVLAGQTQTVGAISGRTLMPTEIRLVEPKQGPPLPGVSPKGTMRVVPFSGDLQVLSLTNPFGTWTGRVQFIPNSVVPSYLDTNVARAMTNFQSTPSVIKEPK